jgi:hypothetical protein
VNNTWKKKGPNNMTTTCIHKHAGLAFGGFGFGTLKLLIAANPALYPAIATGGAILLIGSMVAYSIAGSDHSPTAVNVGPNGLNARWAEASTDENIKGA